MERYLAAIEAANSGSSLEENYGIPFADWLSPEGVTPVDLIGDGILGLHAKLMKEWRTRWKSEGEKK